MSALRAASRLLFSRFPLSVSSFSVRSFSSTGKVSMSLIKTLRESSGAPITDCKEALSSVPNSASLSESELLQAAGDWLRKKGLASASKKAGRNALEGAIGVQVSPDAASISLVEVNSETDFCAKNERFQGFVRFLSREVLGHNGSATQGELPLAAVADKKEIQDNLLNTLTALRENVKIRRVAKLSVDQSKSGNTATVGYYIHSAIGEEENNEKTGVSKLGKTGCIVAIEGSNGGVKTAEQKSALRELANKIAMQVVAANPKYFSKDTIPTPEMERERGIAMEQAKLSGKSGKILDNIIEGRMKKFYEEYCFLEQKWVIGGGDEKPPKVGIMVENEGKKCGIEGLKVSGYVKFTVGEGLTAASGPSFAEEVASKLKK